MAIFVCTTVGGIHFRVNACEKTVKAGLTSVDLTAMPLYKCWHAEQFQDIPILFYYYFTLMKVYTRICTEVFGEAYAFE